jgi:hypothetical protein
MVHVGVDLLCLVTKLPRMGMMWRGTLPPTLTYELWLIGESIEPSISVALGYLFGGAGVHVLTVELPYQVVMG